MSPNDFLNINNNQALILVSDDDIIRYKSSSGGAITSIIKSLFESESIKSTITFNFTYDLFKPEIIYSFNEYKICGSIYHNINIPRFIKDNIDVIKLPFLVVCLPCQVNAIRKVFIMNEITEYFIISLICSSQQSKDATYFLFKKLKININDISLFQYRGNGWPSGVTIKLKNSNTFFLSNENSLWTDIFHSQIFTIKRCFRCHSTFGEDADICVGDPWNIELLKNDNVGASLVFINNSTGLEIIKKMIFKNSLRIIERISLEQAYDTQKWTAQKKLVFNVYGKIFQYLLKIIRNNLYINVVFGHSTKCTPG